jgi:hypothetical protein
MVALADWYILPILPPIGDTFRTFGKGITLLVVPSVSPQASWTPRSTIIYGAEYTTSTFLAFRQVCMDQCMLQECVIAELQVQLVIYGDEYTMYLGGKHKR